MEKYIIGADVGTTFAKVILFDAGGNEVDVMKGSIRHFSEQPLYMEMDMREVYDEVCNLIKGIKEKNSLEKEQIVGLGIGGQSEGLWPIGYDGEPCGHGIMWCDARASEIAGRLFADPEKLAEVMNLSGSVLTGGSGGAIIRWIMENEPERFEKIQWIGTCFDWLKFKMTGEMTLGSSYTADLLNVHTLEYSDELLQLYDVEAVKSKIPPFRKMSENFASLSGHAARKMGLCEGIPVVGGPFDMVSCALGVGAVDPGCVAVVLGTSNIVAYPQDSSVGIKTNGMAVLRPHACDERWVKMVGTMTCTPNFDWAIHRFGNACGVSEGQYEKLEEVMGQIPIGCDGVVYHPYLSPTGERSPFMNPTARAQFTGLSLNHTAAHMLRAVYEGVGYSIMDCMDVMSAYEIKELRVAGGGGRSPFIMQMLADMAGVKTVKMKGAEEGAKGSAIVASVAAGKFEDIKEAADRILEVEKEYIPNPDNTAKYKKMYGLYRKIREDSEGFWGERESVMSQL